MSTPKNVNSQIRNTSLGKMKNKNTLFKIFEGFLIVEGNLSQLGQNVIDPKISLSYPYPQPADR